MAPTTRKLNFLIREDVVRDLEEMVPAGERSRLVNDVLRRELASLKRRALTERLTIIRERGPVYAPAAVVKDLRKDRSRERP
jgi:hypothetical protein